MSHQRTFSVAVRSCAVFFLLGACAEQSPHAASASSASDERRLTSEEIQSVIAAANPRVVEQCWRPALDAHPQESETAGLKVMAHFVIEPSGHVKDVKVDEAAAPYTTVSGCVKGLVEKLEFPSSSLPTTVNAPFVMEMTETKTEVRIPAKHE